MFNQKYLTFYIIKVPLVTYSTSWKSVIETRPQNQSVVQKNSISHQTMHFRSCAQPPGFSVERQCHDNRTMAASKRVRNVISV